eukprot:4836721-Alexandrium_andersonii.AAC.1
MCIRDSTHACTHTLKVSECKYDRTAVLSASISLEPYAASQTSCVWTLQSLDTSQDASDYI